MWLSFKKIKTWFYSFFKTKFFSYFLTVNYKSLVLSSSFSVNEKYFIYVRRNFIRHETMTFLEWTSARYRKRLCETIQSWILQLLLWIPIHSLSFQSFPSDSYERSSKKKLHVCKIFHLSSRENFPLLATTGCYYFHL